MSENESEKIPNAHNSDDVESLYSWANLSGAKYRDFSAARAVAREEIRTRMQAEVNEREALIELEKEALAAQAIAPQQEPQVQAPPVPVTLPPLSQSHKPTFSPVQTPQPQVQAPPQILAQVPLPPRSQQAAAEHATLPTDFNLPSSRPAWLYAEQAPRQQAPAPPAPTQTPAPVYQAQAEEPQQAKDANRWFALKGIFTPTNATQEVIPAISSTQTLPVVAVFSLAGGVGKTSLIATLGRSLSARGERVLLIDTAPYGLLPFFFGARDQRPGLVRTFTPPSVGGDAPIQMVTLDPESFPVDASGHDALIEEIQRSSRGANRILIDLATASGAITRRILKLSPLVIVPILPDMNSVVSLSSIEAFFSHNYDGQGLPVKPVYVLNQFDPTLPLHLDVREVLREQLGDRLLPFALRRTSSISEALAEGMTVVDYAPNSSASDDYQNLSTWIRNLSAPAQSGYRGVRWSER